MLKNQEKEYAYIVKDVIAYITKVKQTDKHLPLLDIILDFCQKYNKEIDLVGDAISSDTYFSSFIEKDCEHFKIFKTERNEDVW